MMMSVRQKIRWGGGLLLLLLLATVYSLVAAQPLPPDPDKWDLLIIEDGEHEAETAQQTSLPTNKQGGFARYLPEDDAFAIVGQTAVSMPQLHPPVGGALILVSSSENGEISGIAYRDEDILAYNTVSSGWQMLFDGSDVAIRNDVNGFAFLQDGTLAMAFKHPTFVPGVGQVHNSDIVRFIPTQWGENTNGRFEMLFDGSDVELAEQGEDIDGIHVLADGRLLISTRGTARIGQRPFQLRARDQDILAFTPTKLGHDTAGSWALYLEGESLGWVDDEDVQAIWIDSSNNELYLSTDGHTFTILGENSSRVETLVYAPAMINPNIQVNANATNLSLATSNGTSFSYFDGLEILR